MTVSEERWRVSSSAGLLFWSTPARQPAPAPAPQLEIVFMECVNFPQILSSPDVEIKLKNSRFHKLNKCGWKADTVFLHTPGKITSTWKLVAVSTTHVMQCENAVSRIQHHKQFYLIYDVIMN